MSSFGSMAGLLICGVWPYAALAVFTYGLVGQIRKWSKTPQPFRVFLPPAHNKSSRALLHLLGEALTLGFLKRTSPLRWLVVLVFHLCLVLVFIRHLRYFLWPVPDWISALQYPGILAGHLLPLLLLFFIFRRILVRPMFLISTKGDFILLFFLLSLCLSGLFLRHFFRVDLVEIKSLGLGLMKLDPVIPAEPGLFLLHFFLALFFFFFFPFTKLIHGLGLFFTPTRCQADDLAGSPQIFLTQGKAPEKDPG